jgi:hypothetical protein
MKYYNYKVWIYGRFLECIVKFVKQVPRQSYVLDFTKTYRSSEGLVSVLHCLCMHATVYMYLSGPKKYQNCKVGKTANIWPIQMRGSVLWTEIAFCVLKVFSDIHKVYTSIDTISS